MSEIWERINTLEHHAQIADQHKEWGEAEDLRKQANALRERVALLDKLKSDLLAMSNDGSKASHLASLLWRYEDAQQQISILASALFAKNLISQAQFDQVKLRLNAPTPSEAKEQEEARGERERIDRLFSRVLKAVGLENRSEAMAIYNMMDGPRGMDKTKNWIMRLGERGLIPLTATVGLRYADWFDKLLLPGEDKRVLPGENK